MNGSSRGRVAGAAAIALAVYAGAGLAQGPALKLRATAVGPGATPMTVELFRWSTDAERSPIHTAFSAPPPAPPAPAAAPAAGRGRAARGGRGNAPPPLSPEARIAAALKAAPTFGYIWGDGATGYSIKYAWRSPSTGGAERIVLLTDRRLGSHAAPLTAGAAPANEPDFTLVEMRFDAKGSGEGRTSRSSRVVVDTAANTLALDGQGTGPAELKVTR